MADFTALKTAIQNAIKQNGNEEITGNLLQDVLLAIVTTLGEGNINNLINSLDAEVTARQQAVSAEAQARQLADSTLQGGINTVSAAITAINNAIGNGCVYAGIATPSSTPASGRVFYLALTAGTYTNFNSLVVPQGINILKNNGSTWLLDSFLGIEDAPTPNSNKLVKSGGVFNDIMTNGSAFDLTAYNNGTTYADLNAALTALNALPAAFKKGGMSMKYVQTSDNIYVQFRCMTNAFTTDVSQWQGVDVNPTYGSKNMVESGGVYDKVSQLNNELGTQLEVSIVQGTKVALPFTIKAGTKILFISGSNSNVNGRTNESDNTYQQLTSGSIADRDINFLTGQTTGTTYIELEGVDSKIKYSKIYLKSLYAAPASTSEGDFYVAASGKLYKIVNGSAIQVAFDADTIYFYEDIPYRYENIGTSKNGIVTNWLMPINRQVVELAAIDITSYLTRKLGDWFHNAGHIRIVTALSGEAIGDYVQLDYTTPTYKYGTKLYKYDGTVLSPLDAELSEEIKNVSERLIELASIYGVPSEPLVGDYYLTAAVPQRLRQITSVSGGSVTNRTVELSKNALYLYGDRIYKYNGTSVLPTATRCIFISSMNGYLSYSEVNTYYYTESKQLRYIRQVNSEGRPTQWDVIPLDRDTVYICENRIFVSNSDGTDLIPLETSEHRLKTGAIMLPSSSSIVMPTLCAVKFNNSCTPAAGYGDTAHPIPEKWLYYDLSNMGAIYIAVGKADNIVKLFDWDYTLEGASGGIIDYSVCIAPNDDIICVPRGERFLNRNYKPIIYKHTDYEHPILLNVTGTNSLEQSVHPCGWFGNSGVDVNPDDNSILFAEYVRPDIEPANIWRISYPYDTVSNWEIVYGTSGTGEGTREVEHFHSMNYDMFTGRLYAVSGDSDTESKFYMSTDDGDTWSVVFAADGTTEGRRKARALNMVFTKDAAYWGSDQGNFLVRAYRDIDGYVDFSTVEFVKDKFGIMRLPDDDNYMAGVTYYTCLIDEPYGILLLQYKGEYNEKGINTYFYDIKNDVISIIDQKKTLGTAINGYRCDAVNYYQSLLEKRIVCGYGNVVNQHNIIGNKGLGIVNNLALDIY